MSDKYVGLLQREVERWSRANAPEATPATCLTHIRREIEELAAEVEAGDAEEAGVEMADIVILLAHLAVLLDRNLEGEVFGKWQIVKGRVYERDEEGVYRHVE